MLPAFRRKSSYGEWFCSATENIREWTMGVLEKSDSWICKWNAACRFQENSVVTLYDYMTMFE